MEDSSIPEPDYDDPKELYAFFGLEFYSAQVLEQGVVNLAVALQAKNIGDLTRRDIEEIYENHSQHTFGRVLNYAKKLINLSSAQIKEIEEGLELRNYLAHRFFVKQLFQIMVERK